MSVPVDLPKNYLYILLFICTALCTLHSASVSASIQVYFVYLPSTTHLIHHHQPNQIQVYNHTNSSKMCFGSKAKPTTSSPGPEKHSVVDDDSPSSPPQPRRPSHFSTHSNKSYNYNYNPYTRDYDYRAGYENSFTPKGRSKSQSAQGGQGLGQKAGQTHLTPE
ncbi:hypothetical protein BJY04DRAFT_218501 [Aspergillus karnatakaensis]|uniref:uncharacterized protein n=1 Tax=Aspergillus karnatakaensis TaxID=1810916 RepID=UPI003CCD0CE8